MGSNGFYKEASPVGWTNSNSTRLIIIKNEGTAWGNRDSGDGSYYIGLQNYGGVTSDISQVIRNLIVNKEYRVTFSAAKRSSAAATLRVVCNGVTKTYTSFLSDSFKSYTFTFTANKTEDTLVFKNNTLGTADITIFIDNVSVVPI